MKIVTWNVNGYRAITGQNKSIRLDNVSFENNLFNFIELEQPDIIGLQETKANPEQIADHLRVPRGYFAYYNSCKVKKGYSGVALFSNIEPKSINYGIGIPKFDDEGRIIEADFDRFLLFNVYFPKGYTDDPRLDYKLEFYDALLEYVKKILEKGRSVIIMGDFNTARTEIDLANPKENENTSGFLKVERDKMEEYFAAGFTDAFRLFVKDGGHYTWWSNRANSRKRNIGWRIDYHLISNDLVPFVKNVRQLPQVFGSDHCPVVLELNL
ncbi:MAG TPA: exodeoxyribonuclease III [Candidatus Kapabacteria bacterium]|jgi:exodeoxyribonuclease-3|nr:exodeoxyribonuclease III [Candidatus Kapabacteria bacterium]HPU22942.1 exodeoxyribonuclease III [Candidatus Kapabacteria bacterium]